MEIVIQLGFFFGLIFLGLFFGGWSERHHLRKLEEREAANRGFTATQIKTFLQPNLMGKTPALIVTEVVIASDYFKTFAASLRNLFGGNVKSFERMLERARREANLRLIEQAKAQGYNALCNVRINTANIGGLSAKANAMATILAWATAYEMDTQPAMSQPLPPHPPQVTPLT